MGRNILLTLLFISCSIAAIAQTDFYYYKGEKMPLTRVEDKVVISIPKECGETVERVRSYARVLDIVRDDDFDIFALSLSEFERLKAQSFWEEDSKSMIFTSCYLTEQKKEVVSTPYMSVKIKKEQDMDILKAYVDKYKLRFDNYKPLLSLWYILSVTLESEKTPLQIANELYETGEFSSSEPDLAGSALIEPEPKTVYFPEGTKWTEIRLDTLKHDSWYSKIGDEWVPNFETIEYYVKGEHVEKVWGESAPFRYVFSNGPTWTDSLSLMIWEGKYNGYKNSVLATIPVFNGDELEVYPGTAYQFWCHPGTKLYYHNILGSNCDCFPVRGRYYYGIVEEIKSEAFGGEWPLQYVDVNGIRIIQEIGVTEWKGGECLFGPVDPYEAHSIIVEQSVPQERHYRSMLVHFERNGEVLYDVWPKKEESVSFTTGQMATIILPSAPDASKGKYYRLDRWENGKIVFEEEAEPKARTPYIIVPNEDFSIDLSTVDLEGLSRDTVSIEGVSFIGSYCSGELGCEESCYIDIIDTTPDCQAADGENMRKALVGSLRACLVVNWDEPYSQGGSKGVTEKAEITLQDNPNGIAGIQNKKVRSIYDLQGRKMSKGLKKGLYIVHGKKWVVK